MRSRLIFASALTLGTAAVLLSFAGSTDAAPLGEWNITFGGARDDTAYSVQQTLDGGYILAGWTESYGAGKKDAWLIKTDANGSEQWNRTLGGTSGDAAYSVRQTKDDAYILAGNAKSYGSGGSDAWLIKVGGALTETTETTKAPTASPTQTLIMVPTETPTVSSTEKAAGFEAVLVAAVLILAYIARLKKR